MNQSIQSLTTSPGNPRAFDPNSGTGTGIWLGQSIRPEYQPISNVN